MWSLRLFSFFNRKVKIEKKRVIDFISGKLSILYAQGLYLLSMTMCMNCDLIHNIINKSLFHNVVFLKKILIKVIQCLLLGKRFPEQTIVF